MKCFILSCLFTLIAATAYCNEPSGNSAGANDTSGIQITEETGMTEAQADSLQKAYYIILHSLRIQNEQLERAVVRSGRIIAVLFVVLMALGIMITLLSSRKSYFATFPYFRQKKGYHSGIVCLQMMYKYYYGKRITYKNILKSSSLESNPGILTIEDMVMLAESLGFDSRVVKADLGELYNKLQMPVLLYMPNHMAVLYAIKEGFFHLSDPYYGFVKLNNFYFATSWFVDVKNLKGIALQLYPQKQVRNSIARKINHEKFSAIKSIDRKSWNSFGCELDVTKE
ncbi:MAG: cysteine peptidase family C39 domain-containing protein [Bacteroidales bacterium]